MTKLRPKCTACGSSDVLKDAFAVWDEENQEWVLSSTYDNNFCSDCGTSSDELVWEELPEESN